MELYAIVDYYGKKYGYVEAKSEREALCKYLMEHEEMNDAMLWKGINSGIWKLAEYDHEDEYLMAKNTQIF